VPSPTFRTWRPRSVGWMAPRLEPCAPSFAKTTWSPRSWRQLRQLRARGGRLLVNAEVNTLEHTLPERL
jgi:hypothetical protein